MVMILGIDTVISLKPVVLPGTSISFKIYKAIKAMLIKLKTRHS